MKAMLFFIGGFLVLNACSEPVEELLVFNIPPEINIDIGSDFQNDMAADTVPISPIDASRDLVEDQAMDVGGTLEDIAIELAKLPNVENVEELRPSGEQRHFYIDFRQPLDHFSANSPSFTQRGIFYFRDYEAPTVLMTTGYGLPDIGRLEGLPIEATEILEANQLVLGHRFFTGAIPAFENQDWNYVNIKQGAEDTHTILKSMRRVLRESWIGTGWSKGGMTILFQEYFHPEDLDLAVPMVAPISFGLSDQRYPPFLASIGTQSCRNRLEESMLAALDRRLELADEYNPQTENQRQQYAYQLRFSIIAFPWSFWQFYGLRFCPNIPAPNGSAFDLFQFFLENQLPKSAFHNPEPRPIEPEEATQIAYTYQGLGQLGFQDIYAAGQLQRLVDLGYLTANEKFQIERQSYEFGDFPWDNNPSFDPQPMIDVDAWLKAEARDIIAIYGEHDPWTAGKVTLNEANDSRVYITPGGSHGTFLSDLDPIDYNSVRERLLTYDNRDRVRSATSLRPPKATAAQRNTLRKLLRQEL